MNKKYAFIVFIMMTATVAVYAQPRKGIKIGDKAPELTGKSFTGETYKLSDTSGQLVLIDFWASWCRPCRIENPAVVNAWEKYKNTKFENAEGFTVFSVSLDRTDGAWKKGVEDDKLEWPYHISDLKGWYSKHAATYGVRVIPASFLIDGNGVIIARDLRGPDLAAKLKELAR